MATRINSKRQITIPKVVFDKFGLEVGEHLVCCVEDGRIVFVRQKLIDTDQAYFWTPEWQKCELEANKDIAAGRVRAFDSIEDFISEMKR